MFIKCLKVGPLPTNCYIACDTVDNCAVVIDPGAEADRILSALEEMGCKLKYVILTHGHADHMTGAGEVIKATHAKLCVPSKDAEFVNKPSLNCYEMISNLPFVPLKPDRLLHDGETITFGNTELRVMETPGHTEGSICLLGTDSMFSGDTVFKGSVGRTDLPSGDSEKLLSSIARLESIEGNLQILPGHGEFTTLDYERANNSFFGRTSDDTLS